MKFQLYPDSQKQWRWRLIGDNGSDVLADSGQGYSNKGDCLHGIAQVQKSASAQIFETGAEPAKKNTSAFDSLGEIPGV